MYNSYVKPLNGVTRTGYKKGYKKGYPRRHRSYKAHTLYDQGFKVSGLEGIGGIFDSIVGGIKSFGSSDTFNNITSAGKGFINTYSDLRQQKLNNKRISRDHARQLEIIKAKTAMANAQRSSSGFSMSTIAIPAVLGIGAIGLIIYLKKR